jgi:drug/metabolite transporter (DMT)-like permease
MKTRDLTDLLLLAALWGASFLFMRVAVPEFGPVPLVAVRVAVAALVLLPLVAWRHEFGQLRRQAGRLALLGGLNSALPFVLLSYATLTVTAGFAAILNATTPLWTALIGWLWLRNRIAPAQAVGLGLGLVGVIVLVWGKTGLAPGSREWAVTLAVAAAMLATACYGMAAHYSKRLGGDIAPLPMAAGSQVGSALLLAPLAALSWPAVLPGAAAWGAAVILGIGCTALAYLLYFRLIARVGAVRASAVAFLIPAFASLWGFAFLHEPVTLQMLLGGGVVLLGTALSLKLVAWPARTGAGADTVPGPAGAGATAAIRSAAPTARPRQGA